MFNPSTSTSSSLSAEYFQEFDLHDWTMLFTLQQMLKSLFDQEEIEQILHQLLDCIQSIVREIKNLPEHLAFSYFHSREALLTYLQEALAQLQLLLNGPWPKKQTRRYSQALTVCQIKLTSALEQRREPRWKWPELVERMPLSRHMPLEGGKYFSEATLAQGRQYQNEFHILQQGLALIARLFYEESRIWPDQCTYTLAWLHQAQGITQETCSFLDTLSCSRVALSIDYCPLVVSSHHIRQQMDQAHTLVARYRVICHSSSSKTNDLKQTIADFMQHLHKKTSTCLQQYMHFLDQSYFQERRGEYPQAHEHFA